MDRILPPEREYLLLDLPETDYQRIHRLQTGIVRARKSGNCPADVVIMVEHSPVITLGRRGGLENLLVSREYLAERGVAIHHIERGGGITCHGPGQLVAYLIIHLRRSGFRVPEFVSALEDVMLQTAAGFGVRARRRRINRGIFAGGNKLGSIGIAIRHGITFHGLALNVNTAPELFNWIHPCGLAGVGATSISEELGRPVVLAEARSALKTQIESVFGVRLLPETFEYFKKDVLLPQEGDTFHQPAFRTERTQVIRAEQL